MLAFDGELTVEPQQASALTVDYEYRWSDRVGIDIGLFRLKSDVDGRARGTFWINDVGTGALISTGPLDETEQVGQLTIVPLTVEVRFHLLRSSRVDAYVAPLVGYVFYDDLELVDEKIALDDDFAYGAAAGLDLPLGKGHWLFSGALRYLVAEAEVDEPGSGGASLDIDPFIVQAGVGYRF